MTLNKIKSMIQKISKTPNVKKVIDEVQSATTDIQAKLEKLNTSDAVKKYKELMKKVLIKEQQLQKEVTRVVGKIKKTAADVEKNLETYKKKAKAQRAKIEKTIQSKSRQFKSQKVTAKKSTAKKTTPQKKTTKKKVTAKA